MTRLVLSCLSVLVLSGCLGSAAPIPRDHYYRILVPMPVATAAGSSLPGILSVPPFEADGLLRERPLLFSAGGRAHELQQYVYQYWSDPPPRMLQDQLAAYLRQSRLAREVVTPNLRIRPDFEVAGRLKRLERVLGDGAPRVLVELELALTRLSQDRLLVFRSYAAEHDAQDDSVQASVVALNHAVTEVFGRFLADVRQTGLADRSAASGTTPAQ